MTPESTYHHGNLRLALLDAASQLIEQEGVAGVSLRAVARQAGVSHAAPYRHFRDKNAMLCGIAETGFTALGQRLAQAIKLYPDSPEQQLIAGGVAYVELAIDNPQRHNLMFGGVLSNAEVDRSLEAASNMSFQGVVDIIRNGQRSHVFRSGDADELALTAWSVVHGYAMLASTGQLDHRAASKQEKLAIATRVTANLVHGLVAND